MIFKHSIIEESNLKSKYDKGEFYRRRSLFLKSFLALKIMMVRAKTRNRI
jgi:hypothetical protein